MRKQKIPKSTALIVGAGAVKNAWLPVIRAIQPYYKPTIDGDGANIALSQLVYNLRWHCSLDVRNEERIEQLKKQLANIRLCIAKELKNAKESSEISAREEIKQILDKFVVNIKGQFMLVTTNWDTVVDSEVSQYLESSYPKYDINLRALHIHGSVDNPNHMYLPTEVTREQYREESEDIAIGTIHGSIMSGLELSERVVLYGLSLSPLDAELAMTLSAGWDNKKLKEIIVIDPDYQSIACRVNMLLTHKRKVIVKGYLPNRLGSPEFFTV